MFELTLLLFTRTTFYAEVGSDSPLRFTLILPFRVLIGMRETAAFQTGPDGSLVLAVNPGNDYEYKDIDVELSGKTIHVTVLEGEHRVELEAVHGERLVSEDGD